MTAALAAIAARLGVREGQAATVLVGLVVALVLAATGLPGVFAGRGLAGSADLAGASPPARSTGTQDQVGVPPVVVPVPGTTVARPGLATAPDTRSPGPTTDLAAPPSGASDPGLPSAALPSGGTEVLARVPEPGVPGAVAVDEDGTVFVVTDDGVLRGGPGPSALLAFEPDGSIHGAWPVEGQPETRSRGLTGVAVAPDGTVWVADASTARVLRLDPQRRRLVEVATIPDLQPCMVILASDPCEPGLLSQPPELGGVATGSDGTVYVADRAQGILWELGPDGEPRVFHAFDDRLPGEGPVDVALRHDGSLAVALSARLTSVPPGSASIVVVPVVADGAGEPVVVADLDLGERPGAIAAGDSGRLYYTLPAVGVVIDLGVEQGDRIVLAGDGADPPLQSPTGVAVLPGALVVSDPGSAALATNEPHWVLYRIAVGDRPVRPRNAR